MLLRIKKWCAGLLERHPRGYSLGVLLMNSTDLFLPHEPDYYAFPVLAQVFESAFLDLGANQGHSARGFNKLVKGRQIVSVEANVFHREALERVRCTIPGYSFHLGAVDRESGNKVEFFTPIYKNIVCHSAAATTLAEAEASIRSAWPRLLPAFRYEKSVVETLAVDDLNLSVGIVKMDVQGKEMDALLGCRKTIDRCRPAFLVEILTDIERIKALFHGFGYRPFNFDPSQRRFTPLLEGPATRNLFFVPAEKCQAFQAAAA